MFRRPRPTTPSPDDVTPGPAVRDTLASRLFEAEIRMRYAAELVDNHLWNQSLLFADDRNCELEDVLLELRSTLNPSPPGPDVLREAPQPHAVPVIPGRASIPGRPS